MYSTAWILRRMASIAAVDGLHTGEQFAHRGVTDRYDICALAWIVAEDRPAPDVFFTSQAASMALLETSEPAMQALRALSASITPGYLVPDTEGRPDVIEHVFNWTATPGIGQTSPPATSEIVGRLIRAANATETSRCLCDPAPVRDGLDYSHWAGCPVADEQQRADLLNRA